MTSPRTGPIAIYGATGFTGKLVAAELRRRGADLLLAGRNEVKLAALAESIGGAETRVARTDDPAALRALLEPCSAVIACAGPFGRNGEAMAAAAADTGTNYVDTTGEQPFMNTIFDRYGAVAESNGGAMVTAMGFDYFPGDMIASVTADGMGPLEDITLAYAVQGMQATRGTTLSSLDAITGGDLEFTGGRHRAANTKVTRGWFEFPSPIGRQRMIRYPAGEPITVPRHVETRQVTMLLSASTIAPKHVAPLLRLTMPPLALAMRTPLRSVAAKLVDRLPEGPDDATRNANRFTIVCDARSVDGRTKRGVISGIDVYGLTAASTAEAAIRMSAADFKLTGALAPSEAFDARSFLGSMAEAGITYEVDPAPAPVST